MAGRLVYRINERAFRRINERAFRRERLIRDRTNPLDIYSESELIERFRFGRQALFELIEELSPQLQHLSDRNSALSPALQVLIALRFYANGAFQNTMGDMINVHRTTACRAIRRVSLALQRLLRNYIHLPTQEEAARTKQDFYLKSGIPGIVGCIDGTHIRIQAPSEHEYLYLNRKGYHSLNVQLVCNSDMTIIDLVARWPGSTHDARILRESALYQDFEAERVNGLLLGDSGYPLKRWLMTPLIAPRTAQEHNYNRKHTSTRNIVERCIGVLKRRSVFSLWA